MAGRPRTRARVQAEQHATIEPIMKADRRSMFEPATLLSADPVSPGWSAPIATLRDCVELARRETAANMRTLVEIRDSEAPPMVRLAATACLLDRAYGRPHQSIAVADVSDRGQLDLSALSGDELRVFEQLLTKASSAPKAAVDVTPGRGVLPDSD